MTVAVAGAPVSFGVFELTPEDSPVALPDGEAVMTALAATGYQGIDLGPRGFLDAAGDLRERLVAHGLPLAGGWVDLPFSDDAAFRASLPNLDAALDVFEAARIDDAPLAARPTLADSGDEVRRRHPGGPSHHRLDRDGWARLGRNVGEAVSRVRDRGFEPTFHHHACTFVETPEEIDELLAVTDVGLTLDTGHLIIGGGDPADAWRRWGSRIDHLHLKDVDVQRVHDIVGGGGGMIEVWAGGAFVPIGEGDLDVAGFLTQTMARPYSGWIVIEQDVYPQAGYSFEAIVAEHRRNRDALRPWI
jgi:inosose dehydratase